jgi:hypothetical protein
MLFVARELLHAVKILFTTTKFRLILLGIVLLAATISVSELAVAKLFTKIISHEKTMSHTKLIILVIGFFVFFGVTKAGHFLQRIYKIKFFDNSFKAGTTPINGAKDNWRWSLAFELTNLLSTCTQLGVIILFFAYLNWRFALLNIVVAIVIFEIYGILFSRQLKAQRGFVIARKNKEIVTNAVRIGTRIKSGEIGILISGVALLVLLGALIYLSYIGGINRSNTIVLFFGLKMQNSNFSNISTALMRFARARTNSEGE